MRLLVLVGVLVSVLAIIVGEGTPSPWFWYASHCTGCVLCRVKFGGGYLFITK
jgi:hypothetical protein